ncbi:MAG: hypothetical protein ACI8UO_001626 [Verrucomicrobiales bacterium]|jgi:hypothetical protein
MLILYTTEDGESRIQLRAENDSVWLSQLEMAELFNATKQNISLHLKNIFEDRELSDDSVVKESLTTAADGKDYRTKLYNLDAILAVGYRVRSPRGVQFRRWASTVLKDSSVVLYPDQSASCPATEKSSKVRCPQPVVFRSTIRR